MFDKTVSPLNVSAQKEVLRTLILPASYSDDFLLLTGPQIMVVTTVSEWLAYHGKLRVLAYKDSTGEYVEKLYEVLTTPRMK